MTVRRSFNTDPHFITTDSSPIAAASVSIPANNTCRVRVRIVARATDGTSALWELAACGKGANGGAASLVGAVSSAFTAQKDAGAALWNAALAMSGDVLQCRVTGDALQRVGWWVDYEIEGFSLANWSDVQATQ